MSESRLKVAFICTHNSCRSQIAEALGRKMHADAFTSFSAGTEVKASINPDAVRLIKDLFDLDMTKTQRPKLLGELPPVDIIITMGCGVQCPSLPCRHREDWLLEDPTGKEDAAFLEVIKIIEAKLEDLSNRISKGVLS